jgi:hypothetical protein
VTTRAGWAVDFLEYAGWAFSQEKQIALVAQASKENTHAVNNPLATTEDAPGATDHNAAGVKNYPSYNAGLAATLATFRNGHYPQLVAILEDPAGGSAAQYAVNIELNAWGTGNCLAEVESIRSGDPHDYMGTVIAGGKAASPGPTSPAPPPTPPRMKGPTMFITTQKLNGALADFLVSGGVATWILSPADLTALQAAGVVAIALTAEQFSLFTVKS